jgi:hypothetical protein
LEPSPEDARSFVVTNASSRVAAAAFPGTKKGGTASHGPPFFPKRWG